jgi:hypothetical protein
MLFKRTFNPIHVIAVSIWYRADNPIIAGSRVAKKSFWNVGHYLTNVELAHCAPRIVLLEPYRPRDKEGK